MASANVDLVRSIYAAIGRGDYRSAEWADPRIEYVHADGPEPGTVTGLDGMAEAMISIFGVLREVRTEAEDYRELDAVRVVALVRNIGRGKASGLPVDQKGAEVFEIHGGKVTRITVYFDRDRALADLGLVEEAMSQENVDLVRAGWEEFNRTGHSPLWLFDPEIEWHTRVNLPDAGSRKGHEGILRLGAEWMEAFEDFHVELDELIDAGHCVIVVLRLCGRPRGGSHEIDVRETQVWKLTDGKAVEVHAYLTRAEALEAVGLA
jgi:ketosteroid isomerase-like protein